MKLDLETKSFSVENALYFAELSAIAYESKDAVKVYVQGDGTNKGMGFDHFHWFEVSD